MKDILCLTHPIPKDDEQADLWKRVLEDRLETPVTWETELSAKGNKKEVWEKLILEDRLGYMALMRNLRNIFLADVSDYCKRKVYEVIANEERVLKNKQLPFRYHSAYKSLKNADLPWDSKILNALEDAIEISTQNLNVLEGKTLIAADVSASMSGRISDKSEVQCSEIATLLMSIANSLCEEAITTTFDTSLKLLNLPKRNGIISNMNSIPINGGGTDITLPIKYLLERKIFVDRIIILSDNEINSGWETGGWWGRSSVPCQKLVEDYKREINPNVWVHAIDLQGYGTQQFNGQNVNLIAGWNENILDFMALAEKGEGNLRQKIEGYYFK